MAGNWIGGVAVIVDALLDFFESAFNLIVGLFPTTTFNPVEKFGDMLGVLGGLDYFLPIHELAALIVAFLLLGAPFLVVSLVIWIVALIRGGSAVG